MKKSLKELSRESICLVFFLSFFTITLELVLSRMSAFYLNYSNAFLAIPITLFGLALGSLTVHISKREVSSYDIDHHLQRLVAVSFISFVLVFLLFSRFFSFLPITHQNRVDWVAPLKTAIFAGLFIFPFYYIGKIFTILFTRNRNTIGRLYGVDLIGASLGCLFTPLFFHFFDLPYLIAFCLLTISLLSLYLGRRYTVRALFKLFALNCAALAAIIFFESNYDLGKTVNRIARGAVVTELAHKWNEFSRVSLLLIKDRGASYYRIIHDNAESNVGIIPYRMSSSRSYEKRPDWVSIPFLLNRTVNDVLVMFAGCGKQMVLFNDYSAGKANITGVEINPLVKDIAIETPELKGFRMNHFYARPNINLVIQEGRYFLDNDPQKYDVIYAGSDAATTTYKTGHSRKYLDTYEAMTVYFEHLNRDGLLIFQAQPSVHKLEAIKKYFSEKGIRDFEKSVVVLSSNWDRADTLVVSLKPFSPAELATIKKHFEKYIYYAWGYERNRPEAEQVLLSGSPVTSRLVTDDRPYIRPLDFDNYSLFPSIRTLSNHWYYRSWIKITTLVFVLAVLFLIVSALYLTKTDMPPAYMVIYLAISGFCYMLVEITFIARLDLFLGNPLLSMSLLLFIFLLSNGIGSTLFAKLKRRLNMDLLPFVAAVVILATIGVMALVVSRFIGLPMLVKIPLTVMVIAPAAFCLGLFYPYAVTWLNDRNRVHAIPITYGVSTLSSVAGATYAMTMIINFGYTHVIFQAIVGYLILFMATILFGRFAK